MVSKGRGLREGGRGGPRGGVEGSSSGGGGVVSGRVVSGEKKKKKQRENKEQQGETRRNQGENKEEEQRRTRKNKRKDKKKNTKQNTQGIVFGFLSGAVFLLSRMPCVPVLLFCPVCLFFFCVPTFVCLFCPVCCVFFFPAAGLRGLRGSQAPKGGASKGGAPKGGAPVGRGRFNQPSLHFLGILTNLFLVYCGVFNQPQFGLRVPNEKRKKKKDKKDKSRLASVCAPRVASWCLCTSFCQDCALAAGLPDLSLQGLQVDATGPHNIP